MMHKNFLSKEALALPIFSVHSLQMSRSDCAIANYLSCHLNSLMSITISDLAADLHISEVTVSRFCKKLQVNGLQALKLSLATQLPNEGDDQNIISKNDSCQKITSTIFSNLEKGLQSTLRLLDFSQIDKAAELISNTSRLLLFGYGNSSTVCHDFALRFLRLGKATEAASDPHQQTAIASLCDRNCTIVAVSHSGSSKNLIEVLKLAKENGAKIIVLTAQTHSPAAKLADVVIIARGPEVSYLSEATVSRLIQMAIGDAIFTRISMLKQDQCENNLRKMRMAVSKLKL